VNNLIRDYNITVKVTETYTRHQAVRPDQRLLDAAREATCRVA